MEELLLSVQEYLLSIDGNTIYFILFFSLMGGAIGLPIPEDIPLVLSGVLAHRGTIHLKYAFIVCYVSIIIGDLIVYSIGRMLGPKIFQLEWFKKRFSKARIRKVRLNLEKRSLPMIFIARHLFYLRSATFLTCGAVKMRVERFVISDAVAALISVPVMIGLGYLASEQLEVVFGWIDKAKDVSLLVAIVLLVLLYMRINRKNKVAEEAAEESQG